MRSLENKICVITGANSGIGKAAASALAGMGARLVLIVRNRFRGEAALKDIISRTGNKKIEIRLCHLSSLDSVRECASNIRHDYKKLDILINNAGAYFSRRHLTKDSIEASFQVNYLSRFLLTFLLLDRLSASGEGRIINVNGEYHRRGELDLNNINFSTGYSGMKAAANAKLAELLFTMSLAGKIKHLPVTVNAVHPGIVATNSVQNDPDASYLKKILYCAVKPFLMSPAQGAETIVHLAAGSGPEGISGKYFVKNKITAPSGKAFNINAAAELWKLSEKLTELDTEEILNRIKNEKTNNSLYTGKI